MNARVAEVLSHIGANVRAARQKAGLTQEQLGEAIGVELRTIQRIEAGRTKLGVETLVLLAEVLQVKPASLLKEVEVPEVKKGRPKKGR